MSLRSFSCDIVLLGSPERRLAQKLDLATAWEHMNSRSLSIA